MLTELKEHVEKVKMCEQNGTINLKKKNLELKSLWTEVEKFTREIQKQIWAGTRQDNGN